MKILHVCYSDNKGGAAKAALRLCTAQRNLGVDAKMFVASKKTDIPYILSISKIKLFYLMLVAEIISIIVNKFNKSTNPIVHSINLFGCGLAKKINKIDCDIVHLHWINCEMLSVKEIAQISKPIVWTLHDSWAFCGAEHYQNGMEDNSFIEGYFPSKYKGFNINKWVLKRKNRFWKNNSFYIVAPSVWETESAMKSSLFKNNKICTIPNCLNLKVFKPIDKNIARNILNLCCDKQYVLFGAAGVTSIKGGDLLKKALEIFVEKYTVQNTELLIFGSSYYDSFLDIGLPVHFLGVIHDECTMSLIYNSADVMLVPSRMDNLPQTATESISCGVPVVCFNVGGLIDIVDHKRNGYIANRFDIEDFAKGINWILNHNDYLSLSMKAREKALAAYSEDTVVSKYMQVYNTLINNK
jgi:glycosyltransferase involved in cell wall biosynthesis